jgi:hypothetical protein
MNELDKALDDLDGLREAFHALLDTQRASPLVTNAKLGKREANQEVPHGGPCANAHCCRESEETRGAC